MLLIDDVSAGYGSGDVLHGVTLPVPAGAIVALVGANGAGKSTLARVVSGLLPAHRGRVLLDGIPIQHASPAARVAAGFAHVPEGRQIFSGLSVADNLRLGAFACRARLGPRGIAERVDSVCNAFPMLRGRLRDSAGALSGGQQQMLAIGRALMSEPRLLLLDEPSLGLAPRLVDELFRLIHRLRTGGLGILLSEQNARQSLAIADHAHIMERGRIVLSGSGTELLQRPDVVERYLGVGPADRDANAASAERRAAFAAGLADILR